MSPTSSSSGLDFFFCTECYILDILSDKVQKHVPNMNTGCSPWVDDIEPGRSAHTGLKPYRVCDTSTYTI